MRRSLDYSEVPSQGGNNRYQRSLIWARQAGGAAGGRGWGQAELGGFNPCKAEKKQQIHLPALAEPPGEHRESSIEPKSHLRGSRAAAAAGIELPMEHNLGVLIPHPNSRALSNCPLLFRIIIYVFLYCF